MDPLCQTRGTLHSPHVVPFQAYSLVDREVGYCQGSAFIVGLLLMQVGSLGPGPPQAALPGGGHSRLFSLSSDLLGQSRPL